MPKRSQPAKAATETSQFQHLIGEFLRLRRDMVAFARSSGDLLRQVHPNHRDSAENLLHYIALRSWDLRDLQMRLASLGLSSIGRAESHVLSAVDAVLLVLHRALGREWKPDEKDAARVDLESGRRCLVAHTEAVVGPIPPERGVAIMVTMPSEAADDFSLVHQLVQHGMDCMRINCAHDDEVAWGKMIEHLRRAEEATNRRCRVMMDLAGPKLRTGPLEAGPAVIKVTPRRDAFGFVTNAARIWLSDHKSPRKPPTPADASLEFPNAFLKKLEIGDRLSFTDARKSKRSLTVAALGADGCWAEAARTCYLIPGIKMKARRPIAGRGLNRAAKIAEAAVAGVPATEATITVNEGDLLILTREQTPGKPAEFDSNGRVLNPASIACSSAQVFKDAESGERIWIDDGKIGGVIERKERDRLHMRITQTPRGGAKLAADKGINLPDSDLHLEAMTDKDREDLKFIARHADMVALSFVNSVEDVRKLQKLLAVSPRRGDENKKPAIVLKIETKRGFENLPAMLLEAMKAPRCGVMIARGDLAVECGFESLAEVQEDILWICEAAHVPSIWATQVLESLAKEGQPSRAEITDAAMSHRAECVMLNKGPYIVEAVQVLDDILRRMHGHQEKKRSMLRELDLVTQFRKARKRKKPTGRRR